MTTATLPTATEAAPTATTAAGRRAFSRRDFDREYDRSVATGEAGAFLEVPDYYEAQRERYYRTLCHVAALDLPRPAKILEVGGGQMALLCKRLFGDEPCVGDVSADYAQSVTRQGVEFFKLDLLVDDLPDEQKGTFDLVILAEVIEHLPVPGYVPLEKIKSWLKDGTDDAAGVGGRVLVTTPNLYRIRNVWRLLTGRKIFCNFHYPDPGKCGGHQLEYSHRHLAWALQRAGLRVDYCRMEQLTNHGHSAKAKVLRAAASPMHAVPRWRDNLVAVASRTAAPVPMPTTQPW